MLQAATRTAAAAMHIATVRSRLRRSVRARVDSASSSASVTSAAVMTVVSDDGDRGCRSMGSALTRMWVGGRHGLIGRIISTPHWAPPRATDATPERSEPWSFLRCMIYWAS